VTASCDEGVLSPHGPVGLAERVILMDATVIMLAVIVPIIILVLAFAWWFRAGNKKAQYLPDWEYSGRIEMIVWAIPALIIMFLGGIAWIGSHDLDPPNAIASAGDDVEVQVVSLDWKWLFIYPKEGVASVNHLVVPVGKPVHFQLTSATVMNSFFVPQLGSQMYTMPGMTTRLVLQADQAGSYKGISAQYSGEGFSDMHFDVVAEPEGQYRSWLQQTKAAGNMLDKTAYDALAHPSSAVPPTTYRSVSAGLFETVSGGSTMAAHMHQGNQ
ncbi:MAG TPA: ubiquinol oxidase subunit II, partial [Terriglobales bacterium]|nr:ubiquinol oxidase subunit II [Terriglobales bacterium]